MASDATGLRVVDLQGGDGTNLVLLDVEEVDVVGGGVADGEEEHGVGELAMHPQVLVEGQEADLGPQPAHDGAADGEQDEHGVDAEDKTGTSGDPDGECEGVETG